MFNIIQTKLFKNLQNQEELKEQIRYKVLFENLK